VAIGLEAGTAGGVGADWVAVSLAQPKTLTVAKLKPARMNKRRDFMPENSSNVVITNIRHPRLLWISRSLENMALGKIRSISNAQARSIASAVTCTAFQRSQQLHPP
jgi:hypothetical protein